MQCYHLPTNSPTRKNKQRIQAMINFLFALFEFCMAEFVRPSSVPYLAQGAMLSVAELDVSSLTRQTLCLGFWTVIFRWGWPCWWEWLSLFTNGVTSSAVLMVEDDILSMYNSIAQVKQSWTNLKTVNLYVTPLSSQYHMALCLLSFYHHYVSHTDFDT